MRTLRGIMPVRNQRLRDWPQIAATSGDVALTDELNNDFAEIPLEDLYESQNPLVPGRTCGTCMLCCKVMRVDELNKSSGVLCSHAVAGSGCTIREHRPKSCRQFFCGWRLDPNIDSLWKPSISGFVLTISVRYASMLVMVDPARPLAWKTQPYHGRFQEWAARAFVEDKRIVAIVAGGEATVILPDRDVPIGVLGVDDEIILSRNGMGYHAERRRRAPSGAAIG
jgi:hypothetical protein